MLTRREIFALGAAACAAAAAGSRRVQAAAFAPARLQEAGGPFSLPDLPYAPDALEPHIDAETMRIHHGRHHAAYVNNLNAALKNHPALAGMSLEDLLRKLDSVPQDIRTTVRNNGGGHHNHALFWTSLRKGGGEPGGDLARGLNEAFGSYQKFREALTGEAMGVFGSGWGWLSLDSNRRLIVERTPNQDSPIMTGHTPLLGIDVWEHAYYLNYQNRRRDYVDAFFEIIDWRAVQDRYATARA